MAKSVLKGFHQLWGPCSDKQLASYLSYGEIQRLSLALGKTQYIPEPLLRLTAEGCTVFSLALDLQLCSCLQHTLLLGVRIQRVYMYSGYNCACAYI